MHPGEWIRGEVVNHFQHGATEAALPALVFDERIHRIGGMGRLVHLRLALLELQLAHQVKQVAVEPLAIELALHLVQNAQARRVRHFWQRRR